MIFFANILILIFVIYWIEWNFLLLNPNLHAKIMHVWIFNLIIMQNANNFRQVYEMRQKKLAQSKSIKGRTE